MVSGEVGPGAVTLDPLLIIPGAPQPWPAGDSRIVLSDTGGTVLSSIPIALPAVPEDIEPGATLPFLFQVPLPAGCGCCPELSLVIIFYEPFNSCPHSILGTQKPASEGNP